MGATQDNKIPTFLIEAKKLSELGGVTNRRDSLMYLRLAMAQCASNLQTWVYYLDIQLEWYTRIKSIPTNNEIKDIENALHKIEEFADKPGLSQTYRNAVKKFWDDAAAGFREGTWILSKDTAKANNMLDGGLSEALYFWKSHIDSAAFIALIEEAEKNAVLLNRAQYIYDQEEYEWRKVKPNECGCIRLSLPKESFIECSGKDVQYVYEDNTYILKVAQAEFKPTTSNTVKKQNENSVSVQKKNSNNEIELTEVLKTPITLAKMILERKLTSKEVDYVLSETDIFDAYKGPFTSNQRAKFLIKDTIKVNCFYEAKQPDGKYLITYNMSYFENYNMGVYVRILTNSFKKITKYKQFPNDYKINVKGQLDLYVSGPTLFTSVHDGQQYSVNLAAVITIIDL